MNAGEAYRLQQAPFFVFACTDAGWVPVRTKWLHWGTPRERCAVVCVRAGPIPANERQHIYLTRWEPPAKGKTHGQPRRALSRQAG